MGKLLSDWFEIGGESGISSSDNGSGYHVHPNDYGATPGPKLLLRKICREYGPPQY